MKLLMFTEANLKDGLTAGITKKMYGQLKAFVNVGIECYFIYKSDKDLILEDMRAGKVIKRTPESISDTYEILYDYIEDIDIDIFYIRKPFFDYRFIRFLQKIKINNRRKAILEMPTYPYDAEMKGDIILNIEKHWRGELKKYIDLLVSYTNEDNIFGIKTINIFNGIDVDTLPISKNTPHDNELHMIGVASLADWHGYDRVIYGMGEYYKKKVDKDVYFHVVGNEQQNGILASLRALVGEHGLENKVIFYGFKEGKELDDIFDIIQIGIGGLGVHRKDIFLSSALKEQEYCTRGIPFVIASENLAFPKTYKYIKVFPMDETPINIDEIISFYTHVIEDENYKREIRRYAEVNLTWNKSLAPIVNWMKNNWKVATNENIIN